VTAALFWLGGGAREGVAATTAALLGAVIADGQIDLWPGKTQGNPAQVDGGVAGRTGGSERRYRKKAASVCSRGLTRLPCKIDLRMARARLFADAIGLACPPRSRA